MSEETPQLPEMIIDVDAHAEEAEHSVTPFELFFDLVFVFAFTQVTTFLARDTSWMTLCQAVVIMAALWWTWAGYAWIATTVDVEEGGTRLVMLGVMATMFFVSLAVPGAFSEHMLMFALCYALVRALHLVLYAVSTWDDPEMLGAVLRFAPTSLVGPGLIVTAALLALDWKWASIFWLVSLTLDYGGALFGGGRGWHVSAAHFSERHGLIFIVALGESIVALGVGMPDTLTPLIAGAALLGLVVISTLWWTYFDVVAIVAGRKLASLTGVERNLMARDSYSYLHFPMVTGIILFALGVKKAIDHTGDSVSIEEATALCGGVAMYLIAHVLFRLRNVRTLNRQRVAVAAALLALIPASQHVTGPALITLVALVCTLLISYEAVRFKEARQRVRAMR